MTGQPYDCDRLGAAHVIRGNALNLPLPDNSVDLVVTSPPYFGLRSYQDAGAHYDGQIGSEATPAEFLDALLAATREMMRVLKPSGSIFVNLGDKYSGGASGEKGQLTRGQVHITGKWRDDDPKWRKSKPTKGFPPKTLMGIPWRYAIRCIDELGLILRAEIIWHKNNGLPESVTDRVRRSHEQWFHFVKQPRYFSAVDEIREEHAGEFLSSGVRNPRHRYPDGKMPSHTAGTLGPSSPQRKDGGTLLGAARNPLGKLPGSVWEINERETWIKIPTPNTANAENANKPGPQPSEHGTEQPQPGSVWTIPTQPLTVPPELGVDHFAAYPMEWPRRIIQGWTPNGVCTMCGEGRRPLAVQERTSNDALRPAYGAGNHGTGGSTLGPRGVVATITGYVCGCPQRVGQNSAETRPAVVLDPFGGTGTTALVAKALGRIGITVDLSSDYCRLAEWRVNDPGQLAAALQIEKPEPIPPDQLSLFGEPA